MIFIVTMNTWHDIIIRVFVPTMYICFVFFICLFLFLYIWKGMTSCWQIYFRESKAIYYPHGYLPLSRPGLIKTNLHSHIKAGTRPTLKNLSNHRSKIHRVKLFGNMKPWNEPFRTILFSIKGNTILWKSISWFEGCGKNKGSLFWKQE